MKHQHHRLIVLVCENPLLEVHSNVNVAMREKLVSEVKENREKAKLTTGQCINHIFALVCEQTSLATLKIYFPPLKIFRINHLRTTHNQYIDAYLDIIYLPVIEATKDLEILRLAIKIIGESLLEYIYSHRIRFSLCGAINLMKDFEGIAAWINDCEQLSKSNRDKLARHEILKVCEGVGKVSDLKASSVNFCQTFQLPAMMMMMMEEFLTEELNIFHSIFNQDTFH